MVLETLRLLLTDRCACDGEEVRLAATFDELNITDREKSELAVTLEELYGVELSSDTLKDCDTLEDLVGYIEDRL
ncbi:MAG: acyl carrier protein [Clostridiales bacterium]|nr:acyl carrier protein [Clostridiales bacterium]